MTYRDPETYKPERQHEARDFENSLFAPVDEVQADGFNRGNGSAGNNAELARPRRTIPLLPPQERRISQPEQDITFNRHRNNPASNDANLRISATKRDICADILKFAVMNGSHGITFKEVCSHLGLQPQTASARLSEMKRDGALMVKGDVRREDCSVLIPVYAEATNG